jgi:hypothetical protein
MVVPNAFVLARNGHGRPTLMHRMSGSSLTTLCGLDMRAWSRAYLSQPIEVMMCKRCRP